jgi:Glycosyl transferase family 2
MPGLAFGSSAPSRKDLAKSVAVMFDLTVIICAHNPRANHLRRTLDALAGQDLPRDRWELLLVDNASAPALASSWDLSWHPHARHVTETALGLSPARQCGIREASSDLLVFVDDDNVLDADYLSKVAKIKRQWPQLGVWGSGSIAPEFETEPSPHFHKLHWYFAIVSKDRAYWANSVSCGEAIPLGAGLCVRRAVADAYLEDCSNSAITISGRRGAALGGADDIEISYLACQIGLGIGVFPELRMTHLFPKERLTSQYLLRLFEGAETSDLLFAYKWKGTLPRPPFGPRGLLSLCGNLLVRRGFDRQQYLAKVRAAIAARRIIASMEASKAAAGMSATVKSASSDREIRQASKTRETSADAAPVS